MNVSKRSLWGALAAPYDCMRVRGIVLVLIPFSFTEENLIAFSAHVPTVRMFCEGLFIAEDVFADIAWYCHRACGGSVVLSGGREGKRK
jgi:hypothetical protein